MILLSSWFFLLFGWPRATLELYTVIYTFLVSRTARITCYADFVRIGIYSGILSVLISVAYIYVVWTYHPLVVDLIANICRLLKAGVSRCWACLRSIRWADELRTLELTDVCLLSALAGIGARTLTGSPVDFLVAHAETIAWAWNAVCIGIYFGLLPVLTTAAYIFVMWTCAPLVATFIVDICRAVKAVATRCWSLMRSIPWSSAVEEFCELELTDVCLLSALASIGILALTDSPVVLDAIVVLCGLYYLPMVVRVCVSFCMMVWAQLRTCMRKAGSVLLEGAVVACKGTQGAVRIVSTVVYTATASTARILGTTLRAAWRASRPHTLALAQIAIIYTTTAFVEIAVALILFSGYVTFRLSVVTTHTMLAADFDFDFDFDAAVVRIVRMGLHYKKAEAVVAVARLAYTRVTAHDAMPSLEDLIVSVDTMGIFASALQRFD